MTEEKYVYVQATKVKQPIGEFYAISMNAEDLVGMWRADELRLRQLKLQQYGGYQRAIKDERVDEIRDYLSTPRSTFPTSITVSVDSEFLEFLEPKADEKLEKAFAGIEWMSADGPVKDMPKKFRSSYPNLLARIKKNPDAFKIIDGQHRADALDAAPPGFQVLVGMYIDLDIAQSAEIFRRINSTQRQVNPSIAFQLFGYAVERSPQKTAHKIATALNKSPGSPFASMLKLIGTKDELGGILAQSTFSKHLMELYSDNPVADEHSLLRKEPLREDGSPLRQLFIAKNDAEIMQIVWKFFAQVKFLWKDEWASKERSTILTRTTGYAGFIRALKDYLKTLPVEDRTLDAGIPDLTPIKELFLEEKTRFISDNYPSGAKGQSMLHKALNRAIHETSESENGQ
jgi:DGQHR domain-containing protein